MKRKFFTKSVAFALLFTVVCGFSCFHFAKKAEASVSGFWQNATNDPCIPPDPCKNKNLDSAAAGNCYSD